MRYTDIVKARALRRAGRACEMCGTPVGFESAQFVSAHPIFGILFDEDDCCVLCSDCLAELDPETRAAAEHGPRGGLGGHEELSEASSNVHEDVDETILGNPDPDVRQMPSPTTLPRGARFPKRDPDGGMCA